MSSRLIDDYPQLPNLQFDDGDVLIKLSSDAQDWLLLHKDVLCAASPVLKRSLAKEWSTPKLRWHPVKQQWVPTWTLLLVYDKGEETFFLQPEATALDKKNCTARVVKAIKTKQPWSAPMSALRPDEQVVWDLFGGLAHSPNRCNTWNSCCEACWNIARMGSLNSKLFADSNMSVLAEHRQSDRNSWGTFWSIEEGRRTVVHLKAFLAAMYQLPVDWSQETYSFSISRLVRDVLCFTWFYDCAPYLAKALYSWVDQLISCINLRARDFNACLDLNMLACMARHSQLYPATLRWAIIEARSLGINRDQLQGFLTLTTEQFEALYPSDVQNLSEHQLGHRQNSDLVEILFAAQLSEVSGSIVWDYQEFYDYYETVEILANCTLPNALEHQKIDTNNVHESAHKAHIEALARLAYSQWLAITIQG